MLFFLNNPALFRWYNAFRNSSFEFHVSILLNRLQKWHEQFRENERNIYHVSKFFRERRHFKVGWSRSAGRDVDIARRCTDASRFNCILSKPSLHWHKWIFINHFSGSFVRHIRNLVPRPRKVNGEWARATVQKCLPTTFARVLQLSSIESPSRFAANYANYQRHPCSQCLVPPPWPTVSTFRFRPARATWYTVESTREIISPNARL